MTVLEAVELYRFYHAAYDETRALRGVSLSVKSGEFVAVMGPSGCGKSTLLACLAGLDEPDGGYVEIAGERLTRRPESVRAMIRARNIGILLQSGNLFEHLTVADNIHLQLRLAGLRKHRPISEMLGKLGLEQRGDHLVSQLSGGEAQRAGLAVAMAADPAILLADEPTAEVDEETEAGIAKYFAERRLSGGATLVVTHSEALARQADRIVRLMDGQVSNV